MPVRVYYHSLRYHNVKGCKKISEGAKDLAAEGAQGYYLYFGGSFQLRHLVVATPESHGCYLWIKPISARTHLRYCTFY